MRTELLARNSMAKRFAFFPLLVVAVIIIGSNTSLTQITPSQSFRLMDAGTGIDPQTYEFFPISKWTSWTYRAYYQFVNSEGSLQAWTQRYDTGLVYIAVLGFAETDTSIVWSLQERDSLSETVSAHRTYPYPSDTTYVFDLEMTVLFTVEERKDGLHTLNTSPSLQLSSQPSRSLWIFSFPRPRFWVVYPPMDLSIRRYSLDNALSRTIGMSSHDDNEVNYDTVVFARDKGLIRAYLYAGGGGGNSTYNRVMRAELVQLTTGVIQQTVVVSGFHLLQNYPNPFNPTTVIRYQLPAPSGVEGSGVRIVRIVVYDILGREVAVLVNEKKAPGRYEVKFDGSGLASGMYVYRLTVGNYVEARRMVLVK